MDQLAGFEFSEITAVLTSIAALVVSFWQALQNKPHLRISVSYDMFVYHSGERHGPFIAVWVSNCGAQPTTIVNLSLETYRSEIDVRLRRPGPSGVITSGGYGMTLPHLLEPGRAGHLLIDKQSEGVDEVLQSQRVFVAIHDTWHSRPFMKRVRNKRVVPTRLGKNWMRGKSKI